MRAIPIVPDGERLGFTTVMRGTSIYRAVSPPETIRYVKFHG